MGTEQHDTVATKVEVMRAALRVAELEDDLAAAKEDGNLTPKLKLELREARRTHRELRAQFAAAEGEARPAPVKAAGGVK